MSAAEVPLTRAGPPVAVTVGLAVLAGLAVGLAPDPTDAFGPLLSGALFVVAATAPLETGLVLALASVAIGVFGRVPLFHVGVKPIAIRPEEAAVFGLAIRGGITLWQRRAFTIPVARNWLHFTVLAAVLLAASFVRWGTSAVGGSLYFARWVLFGAVLLATLEVARERAARERLAAAFVGSAVALAVLGFVQRAFLPDMTDLRKFLPQLNEALTDPHIERLVSTVLDPNLLGAMLATAATFAFGRALLGARGTRLPWALACATIVVAIVLTVSRGSMLATAAGVVVVCVLARPRLLWIGALAVPAVIALAPRLAGRFTEAFWAPYGIPVTVLGFDLRPEPSAYARLKSWFSALQVVADSPVLGVGYNNIGLALAEVGDEMAAYNGTDASLLLVAATCGLGGLVLYLRLLGRVAADGRYTLYMELPEARGTGAGAIGAMVALVVASTFTNALLYTPTLVLLWVLAGVTSSWAADRGD